MDFKDILKVVGPDNLAAFGGKALKLFKWYEENKEAVNPVLAFIFGAIKNRQSNPAAPSNVTVTLPPAPVVPAPVVVEPPVPGEKFPRIISRLTVRPFFVEMDRDAPDADRPGLAGKILPVSFFQQVLSGEGYAQMKGERMHVDCTPFDMNGNPFPGGSQIVRRLIREDGHSPCLDYRWWVDGKLAWNSQEMEDPFHLESYEDADVGFTPVFKLETPAPGRRLVTLQAFLPAEYNGGFEVSDKTSWAID